MSYRFFFGHNLKNQELYMVLPDNYYVNGIYCGNINVPYETIERLDITNIFDDNSNFKIFSLNNLGLFLFNGKYVATIKVPDNAVVYNADDHYKTNKIVIGNIKNIEDFLLSEKDLFKYIGINLDDLWCGCCKYGFGRIVRTFVEKNIFNQQKLKLLKQNVFADVCEHGNYDMMLYLYDLGEIDIHFNNEQAFCVSSENGHFNVVDWLINIGILDHHAKNDYAFKKACINGYRDVAERIYNLGGFNMETIIQKISHLCNQDIRNWLISLQNN